MSRPPPRAVERLIPAGALPGPRHPRVPAAGRDGPSRVVATNSSRVPKKRVREASAEEAGDHGRGNGLAWMVEAEDGFGGEDAAQFVISHRAETTYRYHEGDGVFIATAPQKGGGTEVCSTTGGGGWVGAVCSRRCVRLVPMASGSCGAPGTPVRAVSRVSARRTGPVSGRLDGHGVVAAPHPDTPHFRTDIAQRARRHRANRPPGRRPRRPGGQAPSLTGCLPGNGHTARCPVRQRTPASSPTGFEHQYSGGPGWT